MTSPRPQNPPLQAHCWICGSDEIEWHHIGGRRNAPFTVPLCRRHHAEATERLRRAGVKMTDTPNKRTRLFRAIRGVAVILWMLGSGDGE
jgi:hypothetical protein